MLKKLIILSVTSIFISIISFAQTFDITRYGAKADGKTINTKAIQAAIDACARNGGGRVYVPAGKFLTGTIHLRSNMSLYLESGAVLKSSGREADLPKQADSIRYLVVAEGLEGVSLLGSGVIEGTGEASYGVPRNWQGQAPAFRYHLVKFDQCKNLIIRDVTLRYSEMFTLLLHHCDGVKVDGITIHNNYFRANTDGIDPSESKNVIISNCNITAGDDGICFKNGSENVVISNCVIQTPSTGIKFGTSTELAFRNIKVDNCLIYNSMVGIGMFMKDGGLIENCTFTNLTISNLADTAAVNPGIARQQVPIYLDVDKRVASSPLGTIRQITFDNILITSDHGVLIQGMKAQPIQDITLRGITFRVSAAFPYEERKKPKGFADSKFLYHDDHRLTEFIQQPAYMSIAHVEGLTVSDFQVMIPAEVAESSPRHALGLYQVSQAHTEGVRLQVHHGKSIDIAPITREKQ